MSMMPSTVLSLGFKDDVEERVSSGALQHDWCPTAGSPPMRMAAFDRMTELSHHCQLPPLIHHHSPGQIDVKAPNQQQPPAFPPTPATPPIRTLRAQAHIHIELQRRDSRNHGLRSPVQQMALVAAVAARLHPHQRLRHQSRPASLRQGPPRCHRRGQDGPLLPLPSPPHRRHPQQRRRGRRLSARQAPQPEIQPRRHGRLQGAHQLRQPALGRGAVHETDAGE